MKNVDLYGRVRHAVSIDGMSSREAARAFGIDPRTVAKMLAFSVPPGYHTGRRACYLRDRRPINTNRQDNRQLFLSIPATPPLQTQNLSAHTASKYKTRH